MTGFYGSYEMPYIMIQGNMQNTLIKCLTRADILTFFFGGQLLLS